MATIGRWWHNAADSYPTASRLLITADGGGSNGYRTRQWKTELAKLAADTGLAITVCHLPPGRVVDLAPDRANCTGASRRSWVAGLSC